MRSSELIAQLQLQPHPEGGFYREIYRSELMVGYERGRFRSALTSIYFLLERGQVSRWHVVDADEVWHYYEGDGLELLLMPPDFSRAERIHLGEAGNAGQPVHVARAGWWQAARPLGDYALCGCTVAPGFEFSGFRFMSEGEREMALRVLDEPALL